MHRQADHFAGQPIAHRQAAFGHRIMFVGLLAVQRDRIIDRGRNAFRLQRGGEGVAPAVAQTRMVYCAQTDE